MAEEVYSKTLKNSSLEVVDERIIHFQFYHVATEPTCPIWTCSSIVEQMPLRLDSHQVRRFSYGSSQSVDNADN